MNINDFVTQVSFCFHMTLGSHFGLLKQKAVATLALFINIICFDYGG